MILPLFVFVNVAVNDAPDSIVLQNRPVCDSPFTVKALFTVFSNDISAFVSVSIVPISPPIFASETPSFGSLSTILHVNLLSLLPFFSFSARSGFSEDDSEEIMNGMVLLKAASVERLLNNALDVVIEYCDADVFLSNVNVPLYGFVSSPSPRNSYVLPSISTDFVTFQPTVVIKLMV